MLPLDCLQIVSVLFHQFLHFSDNMDWNKGLYLERYFSLFFRVLFIVKKKRIWKQAWSSQCCSSSLLWKQKHIGTLGWKIIWISLAIIRWMRSWSLEHMTQVFYFPNPSSESSSHLFLRCFYIIWQNVSKWYLPSNHSWLVVICLNYRRSGHQKMGWSC